MRKYENAEYIIVFNKTNESVGIFKAAKRFAKRSNKR